MIIVNVSVCIIITCIHPHNCYPSKASLERAVVLPQIFYWLIEAICITEISSVIEQVFIMKSEMITVDVRLCKTVVCIDSYNFHCFKASLGRALILPQFPY